MRFTIRDIFWLTTVVAMGVVVWINQRTTNAERASIEMTKREYWRGRENVAKEWAKVEYWRRMIDLERRRSTANQVNQITEPERQRIIQKSAELGAPQPKPLPPGYGE